MNVQLPYTPTERLERSRIWSSDVRNHVDAIERVEQRQREARTAMYRACLFAEPAETVTRRTGVLGLIMSLIA